MFLIAIILALAFAFVLARASSQPNTFRIERSIAIDAPPSTVFALINDLKSWHLWSPWETQGHVLHRHFSGAPVGAGMVYDWRSDGKAGTGRMEIRQSLAPSKILIQLDFIKPFEAHNTVEFLLEEQAGGTRVTWIMAGPTLFISKVTQLFFSMENLIGKDFEAGLANLKAVSEGRERGGP